MKKYPHFFFFKEAKSSRYLLMSLILLSLLSACIPIEDRINPNTSPIALQDVYFYQDTLDFSVTFVDNVLLDSASLVIQKAPTDEITPNDWFFVNDTLRLSGRRVDKRFQIVVPEYVATGEYQLVLVGFDGDGNPGSQIVPFSVEADIQPPLFQELGLLLPPAENADYLACRSDVVRVLGSASDNLRLTRIGFSFNGEPDNLVLVSADSLELDTVFGSQLQIDPEIVDGTILNLSIVAIDTFGNRSATEFSILVDCDDVPPGFSFGQASPALGPDLQVVVAQGGQLQLNAVEVTDDRALSSAQVYFNLQNEPLRLLYDIPLEGAGPVNLAELVDLIFAVEDDAIVGEVRQISFQATDSVGNISELEVISLTVIEDTPPNIIITNTYINGIPQPWQLLGATVVSPGDLLTFDGKVEEFNALSLLEIRWEIQGISPPLVTIREENPALLPLNLTDFYGPNTFEVPLDIPSGTTLSLSFTAIDSRGQSDRLVYFFQVEN